MKVWYLVQWKNALSNRPLLGHSVSVHIHSETSKKDRATSPQEGLSGTGKPVLPKEVTPGQDAGKDTARTDKGAAEDNLVQSQAKGPKDSASQSHPVLVDVNREPMKAEGSIAPTDDDSGYACVVTVIYGECIRVMKQRHMSGLVL